MRYFLNQNVYNNWYCIPVSERETWERLMQKDDAYNFDAWDSMEKYKVDISKLESFEDPIWR